jgi:hypothetical protein
MSGRADHFGGLLPSITRQVTPRQGISTESIRCRPLAQFMPGSRVSPVVDDAAHLARRSLDVISG